MTPGWQPPVLHTARLVLRPVTPADVDAIFAACFDPQLTEHMSFDTHRTPDDTRRFLDEVVAPSYAAGWPNPWAICLRDAPRRLIGCVGAGPDPPGGGGTNWSSGTGWPGRTGGGGWCPRRWPP